MKATEDIFGITEAKETKDSANINTAGIHRNLSFVGGVIKEIESKSGIKFVVTSLTFITEEGITFESNYFRPPLCVEECKPYEKDEYEYGKKTGNKITVSAFQVFKDRNQSYFYHLAQLGMSLSGLGWMAVVEILKKHSSSYDELTTAFLKHFPPNSAKNKTIDIKLVWDNNSSKKTSFLVIAKAGVYNRVFGTYEEGKASYLSISDRELSSQMSRMFIPAPDVPKETITPQSPNQEEFIAEVENIDNLF